MTVILRTCEERTAASAEALLRAMSDGTNVQVVSEKSRGEAMQACFRLGRDDDRLEPERLIV